MYNKDTLKRKLKDIIHFSICKLFIMLHESLLSNMSVVMRVYLIQARSLSKSNLALKKIFTKYFIVL